jgi:glycosyltransferase involved in cell wall biosynthesis
MFYAGLASLPTGRPVIWHVRIAEPDILLDQLLFRLAKAVIVNSAAVGKRFAWGRSDKILRIHNGVNLSRFHPRQPPPGLRPSLGFPDNCRIVGSIGRFVHFKGYRHLIDAASLVHKTLPDVHWLLVGDGELRGELEQQARQLSLRDRIHFTGWREDTPDLLSLLDLFVLPSLAEHFGRVLIEAMAMAKPVIATRAGGVPEVVVHDETGWLVPPGESEPLASAVLSLLQDPGRAERYAAAGLRRTAKCFSSESHMKAVESLYTSLLQ